MPAIVKFHHLTTCLEGEAAAKLKGIQITAANFITAWDTLCRRYDNKLLRLSVQLQTLANLPDTNKECSSHLNQLLNATDESINVFKALHRPVVHWDHLLIYFIESKLAPSTRVDWAREIERKGAGSFPTYLEFKAFLENRVRTLDRSDYERRSPDPRRKSNSTTSTLESRSSANQKRTQHSSAHHVTTAFSSAATAKCSFCKGEHFVYQCKKFASCSEDKRWEHTRSAKLCINCLSNKHTISSCQSQRRCFVCNEAHHTKLHKEVPTEGGAELAQVHHANTRMMDPSADRVDQVPVGSNGMSTILTTACVTLQPPDGMLVTVRAILDSGSEQCFVTEHLVQAMALRRQPAHVVVTGVGETTTVVARHRVFATLRSTIKPDYSFSALVLKRLTSVLPRAATPRHSWPHLAELQLADPHFNQPSRIDCILNAGAFASALLEGVKRGPPSAPVAINTVFGWVLFGSAPTEDATEQRSTSANHARIDIDLSQALARFWEVEEVSDTIRHSPQEEECYEHFHQTHERDSNGRFVVKLPFLKAPSFSDTKSIAASHLSQLNRCLSKNSELAKHYRQFLQKYEDLGHMKPVQKETLCDAADTCYLPHHPVLKRDTRKLRVVFNASQRDQKGMSLNDYLHTGPKLQTDVILLIIGWNFRRYAVSCDVVKMFRQFLVHPSDVKYQRILWHSDPLETARAYELQTVTYGTACAPFLANACMLQLADDEFERFPRGAEVLRKNRYADDFFAGGDTLQEACNVKEELVGILSTAGMSVDKWMANHKDLLPGASNLVPDIERDFKPEDTVSTLGIRWSPKQDVYRFNVSLSEL